MKGYYLVVIALTVSYSREAENIPCWIIRMAGQAHAHFFTHRDNSIKKILVVHAQNIRRHIFVLLQRLFQQGESFWLPARKRKSVRIFCGLAYNI